MFELGIKMLASYLLGSLNGSLLIGRILRGPDVRERGSGNAGGTNALRTYGWGVALTVVIIDVGKGIIAVALVAAASWAGMAADPDLPRAWLGPLCGAAAVLGHVFPFWFEFRGGKGAATLVGTLAVLAPVALVPFALVWLLTLVLSGFVGLSTMLGAAAAPLGVLFGPAAGQGTVLVVYTVAMALFLVFTHRSNIARMLTGGEDRMERVMLARRR